VSFVEPVFLAFLALVLPLTFLMPSYRTQNGVLVLASCVFYGWVHPWFLALLAFSTLLDFGCGLAMRGGPQKRWLVLSIVGNLGLLGVFKYLDWMLDMVGQNPIGLLLPVGISFFTFQTMSSTFDVYRGKLKPCESLLDYAAFVSLFPQLVAGPIERARNLLPQLQQRRRFEVERTVDGAGLAVWGAFKKLVIADTVGVYVDAAFAMPDASAPMVWAATLGFAVQILADFSGYTDIARGCARMLGLELMENFRSPYLARSPSDFWRRWHISLSTWFHEYVYIPLGGNKVLIAAFASLALSGLWHGASWHFVVWGAYHGLLLMLWRAVGPKEPGPAWVPVMFGFTLFGWLLFREPDLTSLWGHLQAPSGDWDRWIQATVTATLAVAGGGLMFFGERLRGWARGVTLPDLAVWPARSVVFTLAGMVLWLFGAERGQDFIYFQF
jgi:alginate O-acetyltransferase complex protein AlgI